MIYQEYFYSGTIYYVNGTSYADDFFSGFIKANTYTTSPSKTLKKIKHNIRNSFNKEMHINIIKIDTFNKI